MGGTSPAMTTLRHNLSTKLSTTRFSPARSNWIVSLLPSMAVTLPLPNFWWKTRSPSVKAETVPGDCAPTPPSMVGGRRREPLDSFLLRHGDGDELLSRPAPKFRSRSPDRASRDRPRIESGAGSLLPGDREDEAASSSSPAPERG